MGVKSVRKEDIEEDKVTVTSLVSSVIDRFKIDGVIEFDTSNEQLSLLIVIPIIITSDFVKKG